MVMYLTKEEEKMLNGEYGRAEQLAIRTIVKVGEALGATKLIEVRHVHVSGISYFNIGDAGLEFIRDLARYDAKVKVFSTLNPLAFDLDLGVNESKNVEFVKKQLEIINYLLDMGFTPSFTCTPYVIRRPKLGEHLSWAESSAVAYANTVYGARTNREGGPLALLSALIGRTYYAGVHVIENRRPRVLIDVKVKVRSVGEAGLLGYIVGDLSKHRIPYIRGVNYFTNTMVKSFCAALATSSSLPMCIIEGISPETHLLDEGLLEEKIIVDEALIKEYIDKLPINVRAPNTFFIGCPHVSILDLEHVVNLLMPERLRCIVSMNRFTYWYLNITGIMSYLQRKGINIVKDTCIVVSPYLATDIVSNSMKAVYYVDRMHHKKVKLYLQ